MQILLGKYNFHNTNHHFIPFNPRGSPQIRTHLHKSDLWGFVKICGCDIAHPHFIFSRKKNSRQKIIQKPRGGRRPPCDLCRVRLPNPPCCCCKIIRLRMKELLPCVWKDISPAYESTWNDVITPWKGVSSTQEGAFSTQKDVFSRSYTHDLESLHPIQTILTPISNPIFTHDQRRIDSIAELVPQYCREDWAV